MFSVFILTIIVFYFIYNDIKKSTIHNVRESNSFLVEEIHFKTESYFKSYLHNLEFLSSLDGIVENKKDSNYILKRFYFAHKEFIKAITIINKNGKIIHTYPYVKNVIGKDVSYQEHNKYVMKYHKPILGDTFKTVQGYDALSLVFPIFRHNQYNGNLSLLINFTQLNKTIYKNFDISKRDFILSIDDKEKIYYWNRKYNQTNNICEYTKKSKSFKKMIHRMLNETTGCGIFYYHDKNKHKRIKYFASFHPMKFQKITRKVLIARPYSEIFKFINTIIIKFLLISFILLLLGFYFLKIMFDDGKKMMAMQFNLEKEKTKNITQHYIRDLIDSMPAGVIGLDKNKKTFLWNKEIEKMLGVTIEETQNFNLFKKVESLQFLEKAVDNVFQYEKPIFISGIRQHIQKTYYFNYTIFPLMEENKVSSVIIVVSDITSIIKNEQKLLQMQKIEMIENLSAGIAHDMNNILGGMVGSIDLLKMTIEQQAEIRENTELFQYIKILKDSTTRATGIIKQLLSLSKKDNLIMEKVDLNISIKEIVKFCKASFAKNITINYKCLDDPAIVDGDKIQIEQVLLNILINSNHALTIMRSEGEKQGGEIDINIKKIKSDIYFQETHLESVAKEYYVISISDTGVGMDDITKAKIFDPFFSTKPKEEGSGLGLNMVFNIVSRHGGFESVYSEKGKGTTFNIYLPCTQGEIDSKAILDNDTLQGTETLLVVDDEELLLDVMSQLLKRAGYKVLTAKSGEEGLEIFSKNKDNSDIVILDMSLTGITGIETFKEMKKQKGNVKAILASGFLPEERINEALELGLAAFISKPFNRSQILETLKSITTEN